MVETERPSSSISRIVERTGGAACRLEALDPVGFLARAPAAICDSSAPMKNTIGTIAATKSERSGKQPSALGKDVGKELVDRRHHSHTEVGRT